MSTTTTVALPLPNSSALQRVAIEKAFKDRTYIYFYNRNWHSTKIKSRIPENAREVMTASSIIGDSPKAIQKRDRLKSLMRGKNIKVRQGRPPFKRKRLKQSLTPVQRKAIQLHNKSLVEAFTSKRAKEINKIVHKIIMKQVDGKPLTRQERDFLDRH